MIPVTNACGKKNPENQKTFGVPPSIHLVKNEILSYKSTIHDERGFNDKNPFSAHIYGT